MSLLDRIAWAFPSPSGGITTTTAVTMKAAAPTGRRNYMTSLQVSNPSVVGTEIMVRDGAGGAVVWRGQVPAGGSVSNVFETPIVSTTGNLLEVVLSATGATVYVNAQGYVSL